jgi:hypothetical protein
LEICDLGELRDETLKDKLRPLLRSTVIQFCGSKQKEEEVEVQNLPRVSNFIWISCW